MRADPLDRPGRMTGIGGVFFKPHDPKALAAGCRVLDRAEDSDFGRFRYVLDPEDHLVELWEPAS